MTSRRDRLAGRIEHQQMAQAASLSEIRVKTMLRELERSEAELTEAHGVFARSKAVHDSAKGSLLAVLGSYYREATGSDLRADLCGPAPRERGTK